MYDAVVIGAGQAGLAAAWALRARAFTPVVLEAGAEPVGSWPSYYDSLTLFSPARYSSMPGLPFPGDPQHYPKRDEVIDYLRRYAKNLDAEIRVGQRVTAVDQRDKAFTVTTDDGERVSARMVIAASGGFGRPYQPVLPGLDTFTGLALHAGTYRHPEPFAGQRVVVVGAGNSAVQIAVELADSAHVTLASRKPVKYAPQRPLGRDIHFWSAVTGIDRAPIGPWVRHPPTSPVSDTGRYRQAVTAGSPDRRPMFTSIAGNEVIWSDGSHEAVDAIILATGYRPSMDYLHGLGALDDAGRPRQRRGLSTTHEGLGFVGLDWQRSFASATLRGVGGDARYVMRRLSGSPAGRLRERIRV